MDPIIHETHQGMYIENEQPKFRVALVLHVLFGLTGNSVCAMMPPASIILKQQG